MKKQLTIVLTLLMLLIFCSCKAAVQTEKVWLLESQTIYDADGQLKDELRFQYNEEGFMTDCDCFFGLDYRFEYTGEVDELGQRDCVQVIEKLDGEEDSLRITVPSHGRAMSLSSYQDICSLVCFPEDMEGNILRNWNENPDTHPRFQYAEYTFDENDNPVKVITYGEDLSVIGTTEFTWRLSEVIR